MDPRPIHVDARTGDIRNSQADGALARTNLGFTPEIEFEDGLRRAVEWFERREKPD